MRCKHRSADIPLPVPIQVDDIENGARITFITTDRGIIRAYGALCTSIPVKVPCGRVIDAVDHRLKSNTSVIFRSAFEVVDGLECSMDNEQGLNAEDKRACWGVNVKRFTTGSNSGPLPGEQRILKNFSKTFRLRKTEQHSREGSVTTLALHHHSTCMDTQTVAVLHRTPRSVCECF